MNQRYDNYEKAITEALRSSGKIVHHSVKCIPHVRSFMEYIAIDIYAESKQKMAIIVSINKRNDKATLPMTIQKKWDVYRQSAVKEVKLLLHGSEADVIHEYITQIIDIMELEKDYSEIRELLPFETEASRCQTCFVSSVAIKYQMIKV